MVTIAVTAQSVESSHSEVSGSLQLGRAAGLVVVCRSCVCLVAVSVLSVGLVALMSASVNQKKFLFIIDGLYGGGAEILTIKLATLLASMGHKVYLLVMDFENSRVQVPSSLNIVQLPDRTYWASLKLLSSGKIEERPINQLNDVIEEMKPDIIVLTWWNALVLNEKLKHHNVWSWIRCRIFFLPRVTGIRSFFIFYRYFSGHLKLFLRLFFNKKIIFLDDGFRKEFPYNFLPLTKRVIQNGSDVRQDVSMTEKIYDVVYVGRIAHEKQPEHALRAYLKSGLTGKMAFVGDGYLAEELVTLVSSLGISDKIDFIGWVDNPNDYIMKSRSLIISSSTEGLPAVLLDSLFLNVPVVSYDCSPAINSLFKKINAEGYLAKLNDIDDLSVKLSLILRHPYTINGCNLKDYKLSEMANNFISLANEFD